MWLCKQHKVHLLYLPPHASHLLQPLDLAPFSVVKSRYRGEIRALSALDDAAPIKERFVISYNKVREAGLSERIIRAGWKAAGLCPFNIGKVLSSSQVLGWPSTPPPKPRSQDTSDTFFSTLKSSRALCKAQQILQQSETLSRGTRLILGKADKAIERANTQVAALESDNKRLQYQISQVNKNSRLKKRVKVNQNERFANVEVIKAAVDLAAAAAAKSAGKTPTKTANVQAVKEAATAL